MERIVVRTPAPVKRGNTIGMKVASLTFDGPFDLKISTSKIISMPKRKIIKEPAMAKEEISK